MARTTSRWPVSNVLWVAWRTIQQGWYLGFTAFGGPPIHFKIFHDKYVDKLHWVDEQMYQELFAVTQAFSGTASTKMLYCLNLIHSGFLSAVIALMIWTLPGALGIYGLSIGVSHIGESLPRQVYVLPSGLNASVVVLVFLGAAAGLMYSALWYFPLFMFLAGCTSVIFDFRVLHPTVKKLAALLRRKAEVSIEEDIELSSRVERRTRSRIVNSPIPLHPAAKTLTQTAQQPSQEIRIIPEARTIHISWQIGTSILVLFAILFIITMVLRGILPNPPLLFKLFSNMFLAGTMIFGGGPVVIPLLHEYVVTEGWVSPRDFLLGLAIVQAFPGPDVNFAVFLGGLIASYDGFNPAAGATIGYLDIFPPGIIIVHGTMGVWSVVRKERWVKSVLRGTNAAAVGLIYTAVCRVWQVGFLDEGFETGKSLGDDPWWVVVAASSYVGGMWFGVAAPLAIVMSAVMVLIRYAVVAL